MNFLAHIYLSGANTDIQLGNFLGDFVRGNIDHHRNDFLNPTMKIGAKLHRVIDSFTDAHPVVRQSIDRLQPRYHKFAGIIVDVFYDHFLAKNWVMYSPDVSLSAFSQQFYGHLLLVKPQLPSTFDRLIESITKHDWLTNYAHLEGIGWSLKGIARRAEFISGMEYALEELQKDFDLYESEFLLFFTDIQQVCQTFLKDNLII